MLADCTCVVLRCNEIRQGLPHATWSDTWLPLIVSALCDKTQAHRKRVAQTVLPKLFHAKEQENAPELLLDAILAWTSTPPMLGADTGADTGAARQSATRTSQQLAGVIAAAKAIKFSKSGKEQRDIELPACTMEQALLHRDVDLRVDAITLLCVSNKQRTPVAKHVLESAILFLHHSMVRYPASNGPWLLVGIARVVTLGCNFTEPSSLGLCLTMPYFTILYHTTLCGCV